MAYEIRVDAQVHRGGVTFTEIDTNPHIGSTSHAGSRTFDQVLAGDVPLGFAESELEELKQRVRRARDHFGDQGANAWDPAGTPLLVRAVLTGDRADVARLIAAGADVNEGGLHDPPLFAAALRDDLETIDVLLAAGADPNRVSLGRLFTHDEQHRAAIDRLIAAGARPKQDDVWYSFAVISQPMLFLCLDYGLRPKDVAGADELVGGHLARVRGALQALLDAVNLIGSANDAIDHGQSGDAMYADAPVRAREAWALAPESLARILPDLAPALSTGQFETSRWYQYADAIKAALEKVV